MRAWIWTLLLLAVAVGVAVLVRDYTGNVVIVSPPYRIEVSLVFAVLAMIALFVAVYVLLRLAGWSAGLLPRWRAWRAQRQLVREHQRLEQGWVRMLEGQYVKARDEFAAVSVATRDATRQTLAQLGMARTALSLNQPEIIEQALESARKAAASDPGLTLAVACTAADLMLAQDKAAQAANWLALVPEGGARYVHLQRLSLKTNLALGHWETALRQARSLARHHDVHADIDTALARAAAGYLRSANDGNEAQAIWKRLKTPERLMPEVAWAAADVLRDYPVLVRQILQDALEAGLDSRLLMAYAQCDPAEVRPRLLRAESWLARHPDHPDLLRALGTLCLRGELWGPATGYLQRSLQRHDDARTHALLGTLFDHLDRPADASRHWRLATALEVPLEPLGERRGVLPVADTGADPVAVDGDIMELGLRDDRPVPADPPVAQPRLETDELGVADLPPREATDDDSALPRSAARST
ncbi:MAG: protoheme IX synthesis protein [Pigmentiphaga sp.]|nr:protoheme IX synthesis protein [Pigmentiphaga sp.]